MSSIREWSKALPSILAEDKRRINNLNKKIETASISIGTVQDLYYSIINMPLQSTCTIGKFFGGIWHSTMGCPDGNKYVCLDELFYHIQNGNCLIYSFGISDDWSFEEAMANLGCTVRTFDPTIDGSAKPKTDMVCLEALIF